MDLVLKELRSLERIASPRFLEVGCGTGCISLSILNALPNCTGVAIDIAQEAVELTGLNAQRYTKTVYTCA